MYPDQIISDTDQPHGPEQPEHGDGGTASTNLGHNDVQKGANHNDKVKVVPRILDVFTKSKASHFEDKLESKEDGEDQVHDVKEVCVVLGLIVEAHGQEHSVDTDGRKDGVLEEGAGHEGPDLKNVTLESQGSSPCTEVGRWG